MPSSETDARKAGPCTLTCAALQVQILEFSRDETVSYTAKADLLLLHRNRASSVVIVVLACTLCYSFRDLLFLQVQKCRSGVLLLFLLPVHSVRTVS